MLLPLQISNCDPWGNICHTNHPPRCARNQHTLGPFSRQVHYSKVIEIVIIALPVDMGFFHVCMHCSQCMIYKAQHTFVSFGLYIL